MTTAREKQLNNERTARWRRRHPNFFKDYYQKHQEELREYNRRWKSNHRATVAKQESALRYKLKTKVMHHYQDSNILHCEHCRIEDIRILSIDHINGGGAEHLRQIGYSSGGASLYRWLRNNDYPKGFQILCLNCNSIKRIENKEHGYKHGKDDKEKK